MQPNDLPIVCLPLDLPDDAAAALLEFLQELTATLERHYFGQLQRHYRARDQQHRDLDAPNLGPATDPPF